MIIKMFNGWYFFWLILSIASFIWLYNMLKNKSEKVQKTVLFIILMYALILHFVKNLIPPYLHDTSRLYRDCWFVNICGANIGLFPIFFWCKNKYIKDYMFYLGILGGLIAVLYPMEAIGRSTNEWLDIVRFYLHHSILWQVPLLMVMLNLHKLSYKRLLVLPITFSCVLMFIMINQILQSELGFIPLRDTSFIDINYKNSSMIWGPDGSIGSFLSSMCPNVFKQVPVGNRAGEEKYWPLIWLICPMYILLVPVTFLMCMIFDHRQFKSDVKNVYNKIKCLVSNR